MGAAVVQLRKDFATQLALVTAEVTKVETLLVSSISVVSGEIISASANKYRVTLRVEKEIKRILALANVQYSQSKRARGKLKILMDENKAAASDEVAALAKSLKSKIVMLADGIASGAKRSQRGMTGITGVVHNVDKAADADRPLIAAAIKIAQDNMNAALTGAVMFGEARGKAVEQRIAIHRKNVKRWLQIELASAVDRSADEAFASIQADRQKIADNYLSLKAYAVSAADKVV